ncbi:MAG: hypothetical protein GY862_05970 [Gammaproteobacteria bacterium]|nr:hypothetical protein [Gammaproteobacteria bacterium]
MKTIKFLAILFNFAGLLPAAQAVTDCATQTDIPESECQTLISLFNSTTGAGWFDVFGNGWGISNTPCNWAGVVCSDGHVIELDRSTQGLDGSIPDLSGLPRLQEINLQDNKLSGAMPDFSALTDLEILNLDSNELTGSIDADGLPASLQELSLRNNRFSGPSPDLSGLQNLNIIEITIIDDDCISNALGVDADLQAVPTSACFSSVISTDTGRTGNLLIASLLR